ncbi:MAG: histidine kinase internal region [Herbinix sp.]|nr:histidine kinase internal region [Herbinix sp.]
MKVGKAEKRNKKNAIKKIQMYWVKLQNKLNYKTIRTKTIYLYLFCVMVPVLVTNIIVVGNLLKASRDEADETMNNIVEAVSQDITAALESATYISMDLYTNDAICKFLDTYYTSRPDFYQAYNGVFENYVFYASSRHLISFLTLYSDNSRMLSGGRYYRIDSVLLEDWYQKFHEEDKDLMFLTYYYSTNISSNNQRMISLVRKLDFTGIRQIEKLVKLDLNYSKINKNVKSSALDTIIYVCHKDTVIFTNDPKDKGIKSEYGAINDIDKNDIQLHKSITAYGFDYDIYLKGYKSNHGLMLREKFGIIALLFLADAFIPAIMLTLFSNSITTRILILGKYIKKLKEEEFDPIPTSEGTDEIGELLQDYNLMADRMKHLIEYEYKSRLEQQELHLARQQAELLALYSQINPHFMFNVLENIRMRSVIKGERETAHMIKGLARLMRKSADWGSDLITIAQETEFTEDYLNLQKYRFGDKFNFKIRVSKDCRSYMIPSLVLTTFAENCCVHGLNREDHAGSIFISAYEESANLYIEIEDTGIGMCADKVMELEELLNRADINDLQRTASLGMLNACIRLKKYCGYQTKIMIESEEQVGTCIIIVIPIHNVIKDGNVS